ncbi:tyrosine-type recombinase/integrase [Natronococcus roseus]|uniref:tyrosine-type recombinase/integrase n=1 Tax=Natronococcus roseus TaxID=1052014 RepID=UPI00374CA0C1
MSVDDPYGYERRLQRLLTEDIKELDKPDQKLLRLYIKKMQKQQAKGTVYNNAMRVKVVMGQLDTPFVDADAGDIEQAIDDLQLEREWSDGTARNYGKSARSFIKNLEKHTEKRKRDWAFEANPDYITLHKDDSGGKITEEDVFDREQVRLMIEECARNERDRVLFGLLLDMGLRIGAICSLRRGDYRYQQDEGIGILSINDEAEGTKGADGPTHVTTWSTPYLQRYINGDHPRPDDPGAPLLHKQNWDEENEDDDGSMQPPVVRRRLRRITADYDEIPDEKINPHTFRHTAITRWAQRGLSDREIVHRAGWTRESRQLDRYEHLTDKDINNEILRRHGIEPAEKAIPLLDDCPQCGISIEPIMSFCANCGQNLDIVRDKPHWFEDLRDAVGEDDPIIQWLIENPHHLRDEVYDLPHSVYHRVENCVSRYFEETEQSVIGESFIDGTVTSEQKVLDELGIDRASELDEPVTTEIDEEQYQIPYSEIHDIQDEIDRFETITDTELIAFGIDGKALKVVSTIPEEPAEDIE